MGSAEDYPFDPELEGRESEFRDLDKLRCIRDRRMAADLYERWQYLLAHDKRIAADLERAERRRQREHEEALALLAESVQRGAYGLHGRALWDDVTQRGADVSVPALEQLASELRRGGFQRV